MDPEKSADRCALCRTPILPTATKMTINGATYHAGCWDRKARKAQ